MHEGITVSLVLGNKHVSDESLVSFALVDIYLSFFFNEQVDIFSCRNICVCQMREVKFHEIASKFAEDT